MIILISMWLWHICACSNTFVLNLNCVAIANSCTVCDDEWWSTKSMDNNQSTIIFFLLLYEKLIKSIKIKISQVSSRISWKSKLSRYTCWKKLLKILIALSQSKSMDPRSYDLPNSFIFFFFFLYNYPQQCTCVRSMWTDRRTDRSLLNSPLNSASPDWRSWCVKRSPSGLSGVCIATWP